jgi:hypothetical protein
VTHRLITIQLSKQLDARVFAVDYRLAPDTRFPGPVVDVVEAYLRLVDDLGAFLCCFCYIVTYSLLSFLVCRRGELDSLVYQMMGWGC